MRRTAVISAALLLTACQKDPEIQRAEYDRLKARVSILEARLTEESERRQAQPPPAPATQAPAPKPQMAYQLIGTSFRSEGTFRYPSKARCEEARQTLVDNWAAEDEQNRARGIIFTSRPTPSCLPL